MKNLTIKTLLFLILLLVLTATTCSKEKRYQSIYIRNNSTKTIYFSVSQLYPDTTLKMVNSPKSLLSRKVVPNEKGSIFAYATIGNSGIGQIFIFDSDIFETEPWDSIVSNYMVLKRYQFNQLDLEKINWTITYP